MRQIVAGEAPATAPEAGALPISTAWIRIRTVRQIEAAFGARDAFVRRSFMHVSWGAPDDGVHTPGHHFQSSNEANRSCRRRGNAR